MQLLQEETHKRKFQESITQHEIVRSQESATYQFWVTASTKVGEGESTSVVTVPPSLKGTFHRESFNVVTFRITWRIFCSCCSYIVIQSTNNYTVEKERDIIMSKSWYSCSQVGMEVSR